MRTENLGTWVRRGQESTYRKKSTWVKERNREREREEEEEEEEEEARWTSSGWVRRAGRAFLAGGSWMLASYFLQFPGFLSSLSLSPMLRQVSQCTAGEKKK